MQHANYKGIALAFIGIAAVATTVGILLRKKDGVGAVGGFTSVFPLYERGPDGFTLIDSFGTDSAVIAAGDYHFGRFHRPLIAANWAGDGAPPSVLRLDSDRPWTEIRAWGQND